jgi:hypothetical protein
MNFSALSERMLSTSEATDDYTQTADKEDESMAGSILNSTASTSNLGFRFQPGRAWKSCTKSEQEWWIQTAELQNARRLVEYERDEMRRYVFALTK